MTHTLDFPVRPQWIHDVLQLWQPEQPISDLVNAAVAQSMQELGGDEARRKTLVIILRYFVPTEGQNRLRRTTSINLWAATSRVYPTSTLAPAFLMHLINNNEVAQGVTPVISGRLGTGGVLTTADVRRRIITQYGERKVLLNSATAFLRTLSYFGVLSEGEGKAQYRFVAPLPVTQEVFPLLVWSWWQSNPVPQIDLDTFAEHPASAFVQTSSFSDYWRAYSGRLWSVEQRLDTRRATMISTSLPDFERALSILL